MSASSNVAKVLRDRVVSIIQHWLTLNAEDNSVRDNLNGEYLCVVTELQFHQPLMCPQTLSGVVTGLNGMTKPHGANSGAFLIRV